MKVPDLVCQRLQRGGELLLQDCGRSGPEGAVRLYGTYLWEVVLVLHAGRPSAHGHGAKTERGTSIAKTGDGGCCVFHADCLWCGPTRQGSALGLPQGLAPVLAGDLQGVRQ